MRKEDRIRQQAGNQPKSTAEKPQPRPSEQIKGGGSAEKADKPPRRPGVMPIPD